MDFTSAVGYEQVDLDTCLLSERPKLALHGEDSELPPEPQPLPSLVRGAFFNCISQVQSEQKRGPCYKGVGKAEGAQWNNSATGEGGATRNRGSESEQRVSW